MSPTMKIKTQDIFEGRLIHGWHIFHGILVSAYPQLKLYASTYGKLQEHLGVLFVY